MKSSFRPTIAEDLDAVCRFLQRAFDSRPDAPFLDPALMAWKYWDRRDDFEGPRAYVLERDGEIVAHAGLYPVTLSSAGVDIRGVHMIDWASAKESPGAGLALVQKLAAMFDFMYVIGGSEMTRKILPGFGFVEYASQWNGARPLRPWRQILTHQYRNWKLLPRLVRNYRLALREAPADGSLEGWTSQKISPSVVIGTATCFTPRPPAFFEYLLRCPATRIRLYGVQHQGEPQGHFAIGVVRGQARIAGVWLRYPDPETWKTVYVLAQQAAAQIEDAYEIAAAGTAGISEQAAERSGLRIVGHTPVHMLNKKGKLALPPDFQFQLSDDDALFRDVGSAAYWT